MRSGTPAHVRHERLCYVFPVTVCTCKIRGSGEMGMGGWEGRCGGGVEVGGGGGWWLETTQATRGKMVRFARETFA